MRAEILTIGDELCRGEIVNTNASTLAAILWDLDITVRWLTSCADDATDMTAALRAATGRADLVICSGGLGPTEDDLTVDVVSALVGVEPQVDQPARHKMEAFFRGRGLGRAEGRVGEPGARPPTIGGDELGAIHLRQVRAPAGARIHPNPAGLAPAFEVAVAGVPVLCLPGFPREIAGILEAGARARFAELREAAGHVEHIARRIYRVFGRGESQISQACRGVVDGVVGASIHYQVKFPETLVKIVVRDHDAAAAADRLAAIDGALRERLHPYLYGDTDEQLPARVVRRAIAAGKTLATAESCTGGMIGELITRVAGSSRAFAGGAITYANAEKVRQLGVGEATLAQHGAVSEATVIEMATGARERFAVDLAVAVSGIAGPDGGTPDKPVGTVWLALASAEGVVTKRINFPGSRDQIRQLAAWWALSLIDAAL